MTDSIEDFRKNIEGTNIDPRSLLSNDYFNHFNSVIMLLGMLPEMPDLLDEIDAWTPISYVEHFRKSGLDFAFLAIEAYEQHVSENLRNKMERTAEDLGTLIDISRLGLRHLLNAGDKHRFDDMARRVAREMQDLVDAGGAVVHGHDDTLDQSSIDKMFN